MPSAVSLFTGCGGSDHGLVSAGFDIVLANDILRYAREVYLANLPPTEYVLGDIADIKAFPKADLLVGCYPCQGFSQGGVREAGQSINLLYQEFERALRKIKPKAFVVENVAGMVREDFIHLFRNQLVRFRIAGYRVKAKVLDARQFGVPQDRARLFFVGIRSDLGETYEFPEPTHRLPGERPNGQPAAVKIREAIGDLPMWPEGEYDPQPFHWYYLSRDRYRGWNQTSKTIVANSRHMPLHPISPRLIRKGTDEWYFKDDRPARRFSFREAARLQGFEGSMKFPDTIGVREKCKVVGNAVPPPVFRAVVEALPDIW
ncbi:MAG: DNA cytosine methyltransferase [Reyranella sp.]